MAATGINHLSIPARDLATSVRFYEDVFGMTRIPTYNFGFKTQYLACGELQLHVFELEEAATRYQHFALDVADFHAVYERAKALGILDATFGNPVNELPDGSVQMYLRDPAGNLVEVDWPDVASLEVTRIPELKKLSDRFPQEGEAAAATLYLNRRAGGRG